MAAERRSRIDFYVGPKLYVPREGLAELEATGEWVFERKWDGFWCLAEAEGGVIRELVSRTGLVFGEAESSSLVGVRLGDFGTGRLVGELTADKNAEGERCGKRRLRLFDVIDWNEIDFRDLAQTERREALVMLYNRFPRYDVLDLVEQRETGAVAFFDEIIADNGEGIVAKRKDARYRAANGDGKIDAWVRAKLKRTVDYVVMGHGVAEKGTPNLKLGLWKNGKLTEILTCTVPPGWRGDLDSLVGKVVEAEGWEMWKSGALRSAQLGHRPGPRNDKFPKECTYEAAMRA